MKNNNEQRNKNIDEGRNNNKNLLMKIHESIYFAYKKSCHKGQQNSSKL